MAVSQLIGQRGWEAIRAEIAKCDVLCANCHRMEETERREASDITAQIAAAGFFRAS